MSREQLSFIEEETRKASDRAARRQRRRSLSGFVILLLGILLTLGIQQRDDNNARKSIVRSGTVIAVDGCNRDFRFAAQTRRTFLRLKDSSRLSYEAGNSTYESFKRAQAFYDNELRNIALPDCRTTRGILTSDPDLSHRPVPKPLYPGSPEADALTRINPPDRGG
jgi:hypothetical protein